MFKKVAEYYRQGKTAQGLKLLRKILLDFAKEDRVVDAANPSPAKSLKNKSKSLKKETVA